jgi:hypothetical protein
MLKNLKLLIFSIVYMASSMSYAGIYGENLRNSTPDIGESSNNIAVALLGVSNLWLAVATIAGIGFLFVGIVKYHEHKKNPQQTPIGTVFLMLFVAIALIGVAFIVEYGDTSYAAIKQLFN